MKLRNFTLIFIFGLFLFLLPSLAEGYCNMWCVVDPVWGLMWDCCYRGPYLEPFTNRPPVGMVNPYNCADSPYHEHVEDYCVLQTDDYVRACAYGKIPDASDGPDPDGLPCAILHASQSGLFCNPPCEQSGVYDKSEGKCVVCGGANNRRELGVLGTATSIPNNPCDDPYTPASGDGQCESACEANTACDEVLNGNQCTVGKYCEALGRNCQSGDECSGCVCVAPPPSGCTIGGTPYDDGECNGKCQYCDISQSTTDWSDVPSGQVCYNDNLVDVSDLSGRYCNYREDCSNGDCSASEWWTSCDGSGSCRLGYDQTDAYIEDIIASNGYVLKSDCTETSASPSYYCETPVGTCITASTCNGSMLYKGCYNGSCSSLSTYGYNDTSDDSECDDVVCSSTNYCKNSCDWYTGKKCLDGSCDQGYGGGNCDPHTCSDGSCTSICSMSCGAVCESDADCPVGSTCQANCTCSGVPLNNPPTCDYLSASPDSGNVPLDVIFTASGSDSDGTIAQYEFDFGDGSDKVYSSTAGATHIYNDTGIYCAKLRVQDDDGAWSTNTGDCPGGTCTVQITVTEAGPGISPPQVRTVPIGEQGTVTINSATIWGELTNMGGDDSCWVWFEYKKSVDAVWTKVCETDITSIGSFSCDLTDLTSNTPYDFEAFAKNGGSW